MKAMKTLSITIINLLFFINLMANNAFATENTKEKTVVFAVSMDCHSCVKKIEDNISYEKGVKDLKVSLDKKEVTITFRTDKTSIEMLTKAFNKLGYEANIVGEKIEEKKKEVKQN